MIQNSMQITAMWSKSQREEELQYGGRLFFQKGIVISQPRYVDEIWFADRFLPSGESDIIKYETGSGTWTGGGGMTRLTVQSWQVCV